MKIQPTLQFRSAIQFTPKSYENLVELQHVQSERIIVMQLHTLDNRLFYECKECGQLGCPSFDMESDDIPDEVLDHINVHINLHHVIKI